MTAIAEGPEKVLAALDARIDEMDFSSAVEDVRGYLMDEAELEIWRPDIFHQLVRKIVFAPQNA